MHSYFLSDLHLTPDRPELALALLMFMQTDAPKADRVYILGDLFEYWIGDDAAGMIGAEPALAALKMLSQQTHCYFIAGNRDFLVGEQFERDSGFTVLQDETVIDLYGTPTLLLHGDSMCTDDTAHMQFRNEYVNNAQAKQAFLDLPIPARVEQAQNARSESNKHKSNVSMEIMDVSPSAVESTFAKYEVKQMIHGHTHRQNTHHYDNGCTRYVLGDWHTSTSILTATPTGIEITNHPIAG